MRHNTTMFERYDHTLEIIGEPNGGRTDYYVEFTGYAYGVQLNNNDELGEKSVKGHVNGGRDIIGFNGTPKGIAFGENVAEYQLVLDGVAVEPFHINARTLTVETSADKAPYEVVVSGELIGTAETNANDHIADDGQSATAVVRKNGTDTWYYSGVLLGIDSNNPLDVTIDEKHLPLKRNTPVGVVEYDG